MKTVSNATILFVLVTSYLYAGCPELPGQPSSTYGTQMDLNDLYDWSENPACFAEDYSCSEMPPCPNMDCYTCQRTNVTQYQSLSLAANYSQMDLISNEVFADYGAIFQDIMGDNENCQDIAASMLCQKMRNAFVCGIDPFTDWLEGAYVYTIMGSTLGLGSKGKLTPLIDYYTRKVADAYQVDETTNCGFSYGNSCMDNYSTGAAALGWIVAWESLNGRILGSSGLFNTSVENACVEIENSLILGTNSNNAASICARDQYNYFGTPDNERASCVDFDAISDLENALISNSTDPGESVELMTFKHQKGYDGTVANNDYFENPNYGIGLMSSLSTAFNGLLQAGFPYVFNLSESNEEFNILVAQEIFRNGQKRSDKSTEAFKDDCYWWRKDSNELNPQGVPNAPCWDAMICEDDSDWDSNQYIWYCPSGYCYHPTMYPVLPFYKKFLHYDDRSDLFIEGLQSLDDPSLTQFDIFDNSLFSNTFKVFHLGRVSIYRDLGACWYWPDSPMDPVPFGDSGRPQGCEGHDRPLLLGLPAMWVDVPPPPVSFDPVIPVNICMDSLFFGWVYADGDISRGYPGGIDPDSLHAIISNDSNVSCGNCPYPCNESSTTPIDVFYTMERKDVCTTYRDAFGPGNEDFFKDPRCNYTADTYYVGWQIPYSHATYGTPSGAKKLLVWAQDLRGNLKCFERSFEAVADCDGVLPTAFLYQSPGKGEMVDQASVLLQWLPAANATTYEISYGTSPGGLVSQDEISGTEFTIDNLTEGTTYYWRIDAKGPGGSRTGDVWSFTTTQECQSPDLTSPITPLLSVADTNECAPDGLVVTWKREATSWNDGDTLVVNRHYEILRGTTVFNMQSIATPEYVECGPFDPDCPSHLTYTDQNVVTGNTYRYKMRYVNACGEWEETEVISGIDLNEAPPTPTVSGPTQNTCPQLDLTLMTESGMTDYQWFRDGTPIQDATTNTLIATASGMYAVEYTDGPGCTGTSEEYQVTLNPCPILTFLNTSALSPIDEDGDGIVEAGETWSLDITVTNSGNGTALSATGNLIGEGLLIFPSPAAFGDIPPGETASATFTFIVDPAVWYETYACGTEVSLDFVSLSCNEGGHTFPDVPSITTFPVGRAAQNPALQANDVVQLINSTTIQPFTPSAALAVVTSAVVNFNVSSSLSSPADSLHIKSSVQITLLDPDDNPIPLKSYDEPLAVPYDVTAAYNGIGTYKLKVSERIGYPSNHPEATIDVTDITLSLTLDPECSVHRSIIAFPSTVSTAGGTRVTLRAQPYTFTPDISTFALDFSKNKDCSNLLPNSSLNATSGTEATFTAPANSEGVAGIYLQYQTGETKCVSDVLSYAAFAFTANQYTQDISVIDTKQNQVFDLSPETAGNQHMVMADSALPWGMALSKIPEDSTELWVVDYGSGDVQLYDAVNFEHLITIQLQNRNVFDFAGLGAVDVDVDSQGFTYVVHTTDGLQPQPGFPYPLWNPSYGSISIIDAKTRELIDADPDNPKQPIGWMPGYHRIRTTGLYPYSIAVLRRDPDMTKYAEHDGYPGEYAFISGVGPQPPDPIDWVVVGCSYNGQMTIHCLPGPPYCTCPYGWQPVYAPVYDVREMVVGIMDLNPEKWEYNDRGILERIPNENYRSFLGVSDLGLEGRRMGSSNQGLDFAVYSDGSNATVFAVNPVASEVYDFKLQNALQDPTGYPYNTTILGESVRPVDVAVEEVNGIPYAFVVNSQGESITVFQSTEVEGENPFVVDTIDISNDACAIPTNFWPEWLRGPYAIETRSDGSYGYTANRLSGTITKVGLQDFSCQGDIVLDENELVGPIRIVIQPVHNATDFYQDIKTELITIPDTSFTSAQQKDLLVQELEVVQDLQETSANPQAVLVNIDNFQRSVNRSVVDVNARTSLNENIDLYRIVYVNSITP